MEERNVTISLTQARELFNSGNAALREVALQAFDKTELIPNFTDIKTFQDACKALKLNYSIMLGIVNTIKQVSRASAAMTKLNIIRKALNLDYDLHLTKDPESSNLYYPCNPFITKSSTYHKSEINSGKMKVIGKIKSEGEEYNVLGGSAHSGDSDGFGRFYSHSGVGFADAYVGFLGCANEEIAQHFGKYFGMLITEAKYADKDFEVIESKYII